MNWKKLGNIFCPDSSISELMVSHARIPIVDKRKDGNLDIYFGSRDKSNRERVFKLIYDIKKMEVIEVFKEPVLDFGENLGAFDDNGITPCCILNAGGRKLLYYCGWNIHVKIPFTCAVGIAESFDDGNTFEKLYKGAVLDRDKDDHQFVAVNDVIFDEDKFKTWYLACSKWEEQSDNTLKHYYRIKYAESEDGVNWKRFSKPAIDFRNEFEYAISTPRVLKSKSGDYQMWYSFRAQKNVDTYRIGYATSEDGIAWKRDDTKMEHFTVSKSGWDSEMVCYPCIFEFEGDIYMIYNGDGYGKTGMGLALLESRQG